jgi:hypothetical protein
MRSKCRERGCSNKGACLICETCSNHCRVGSPNDFDEHRPTKVWTNPDVKIERPRR